jgi:hypothetical protein
MTGRPLASDLRVSKELLHILNIKQAAYGRPCHDGDTSYERPPREQGTPAYLRYAADCPYEFPKMS